MISGSALRCTRLSFAAALPLLVFTASTTAAGDAPGAAWANGYNSRVRMLAGSGTNATGSPIVAGVEIETKPDWKTYWRNPGDAGVPPSFDWSKSTNVASATVLYPAPRRFVDKAGTTFGYLGHVTFPVAITPADPRLPVSLRLSIEYGVCKEICVPAQAELAAEIAPGPAAALPAEITESLADLPRPRGKERAGDPVIEAINVTSKGTQPRIVLEVAAAGAPESHDAFLVTMEGGFMPLPVREAGGGPGKVRFVVDLTKDVDVKDLAGKAVLAVVTGPKGASEAEIRID